MTHRRRLLSLLLGSFATAAFPTRGRAQVGTPAPIRWIVGYPAGGGADFIVRTVGAQMAKELGRPVVVDNRPGGSTFIAAQAAVASRPDGTTLLFADNGTLVNNKALFEKMPYDVERDFAPVGTLHRVPILLVANPAFPAQDLQALVRQAKQSPKAINFATPGQGSPHHLAMEMLMSQLGFEMTHVPYKGGAPAIQDVLANQVPLLAADSAFALEYVRSGKLKGIAVLTQGRSAALPGVPSLGDAGVPGLDLYAWAGVMVPKATPAETVKHLNTALMASLQNEEVAKRLRDAGIEPQPEAPEALARRITTEAAIWQPLIRARGIRLD